MKKYKIDEKVWFLHEGKMLHQPIKKITDKFCGFELDDKIRLKSKLNIHCEKDDLTYSILKKTQDFIDSLGGLPMVEIVELSREYFEKYPEKYI